jgi:hypothetical protein
LRHFEVILTELGTQCLDQGKDCSGYKTTLTWGVGVASRGKLRGLSLPIANSQKVAQQTTEKPTAQETAKAGANNAQSRADTVSKDELSYNYGLGMSSMTPSPPSLSPHFESSTPIAIPSVHSQHLQVSSLNQGNISEESFHSYKSHTSSYRPSPLQRTFSFASLEESPFSAPSTGSVGTFSDAGFPSPHELPATPEQIPCADPFINSNTDLYQFGQDSMSAPAGLAVDLSHGLSNGDMQMAFSLDGFDNQCFHQMSTPSISTSMAPPMSAGFVSDLNITGLTGQLSPGFMPPQFQRRESTDILAKQRPQSVPTSLSSSFLSSLSPRTASLVQYYAENICPVLVAVDGVKNPYRVHILALAAASGPTLVNAIAALSSNVLYLRDKANDPMSPPSSNHGICEESLQYRTASVNLFNAAIRDPAAPHDDSILATLVVLALFSISEGGLSKLKAQMPEVRNLLALRGSNTSQFSYWATMFFTWLDVMSATAKDKEAHLRTGTLDLLDFSANLGALEYLSFCEGRMYKVIARMNNRQSTFNSAWPSPPESRRQSLNPFTGLPMSSPLSSPPPMETQSMEQMMNAGPPTADARQEFWSEWQHVKSRIRLWSRDPYSCPPTPSFAMQTHRGKSESEAILVTHASEVFRYAALLFAERNAQPHILPSSPEIQQLVSSALHHLSSIPVSSALNRALIWPLMVIGTECISPNNRDVLRLRCGDCMRDAGFFGVLSGLDVLERVWSVDDAAWDHPDTNWESKTNNMPRLSALGGQAGRWRRAMASIHLEFSIS